MFYLTAGESHGKKIVVIVDDVPSGITVTEKDINFELKRRSSGPGRSLRQDEEDNTCKIVSGISEDKTTGNPICIEVENAFFEDSSNENIVRPGHADLAGVIKHNFDSCKNVSERSSARETVGRVIAGTIAKNFLANLDIEVYSYVSSIGGVSIKENLTNMPKDLPSITDVAMSEVMCPDKEATEEILKQIDRALDAGESLGGKFSVVSVGNVCGIGGYAQGRDRLDSKLAAAVVSVPSVKSVEIGSCEFQSKNVGSASIDEIVCDDLSGGLSRKTNYSGGIEGGMTNGMPLVLRCYVKPVPTLNKPVKTFDLESFDLVEAQSDKRSDICVVQNAAVVCESEVALVLATEYQNKFGHENLGEIVFSFNAYKQRIKELN